MTQTCEDCGKETLCKASKHDMLLCLSCRQREKDIESESLDKILPKIKPFSTLDSLFELAKQIELATKELESGKIPLENREDYFNAEIASIMAIKKVIDDNPNIPASERNFRLAAGVRLRFEQLRDTLFNVNKLAQHIAARQEAQLSHLNTLSNSLRVEEREKLRLSDIKYECTTPVITKKPAIRRGAEEKLAESLAKTLRIPLEVARRKVSESLSAARKETITAMIEKV